VAPAVGSSSGACTPTLGQGQPYPAAARSLAVLAEQVHGWKLVPDSLYFQQTPPSSLLYGGVHLARLLVKSPTIFAKMKFTTVNAKIIYRYLEHLEKFLTVYQPDLFGEEAYK